MKIQIIAIFLIAIAFSNQSISGNIEYSDSVYNKHQIKITSRFLTGEIPFIYEYRSKKIGNEFSASFVYLYPMLGSGKLSCLGYKLRYGPRLYLSSNDSKKRAFYLGTQFFYEEIWSEHRYYSEDGPIIYGGGDDYDRYYYDLERKAFGCGFLAGWNIKKDKFVIDINYGVGFRYHYDQRKDLKWETQRDPYNYGPDDLPSSETDTGIFPTLNFSIGLGFPFCGHD
jgi:hypothetical protein